MPSFTTSRDYELFTVHTPELTLAFSLEDGGLRVLQRAGGPNVLGFGLGRPSIDVRAGDRGWLAEQTFVRYLSHTVEERDGTIELTIVIGVGPLMVRDRYRITGTLIARRVSVENAGEDEIRLSGAQLLLPWARVGALDACRFYAPGNSVRPHVPLAVAAAQRRDVLPRRFFAPGLRGGQAIERAPTHGPGLLALHDPSSDEALLCWYYGTADPAQPYVEGNDHAVTLAHEIDVSDWLRAGVVVTSGTQFIMLLREPWQAALGALQRTWPLCGLRALDRPAGWARDAAIYEVHPAEHGGLRGLAAALPELSELGLNTLCLMPIWPFAGSNGALWDGNWDASGNPYAIRELDRIDPSLGTAEDLRALVDLAHAHGMRVLLDLPLEGAALDSALVAEHPEWFCHDERGRLASDPQYESLVPFDWSNDELRRFMLGWALAQARAYDLDGYRTVVSSVLVPNWARAGRGHASAGGLSVLVFLDNLQRELKIVRGDMVLLSEQCGPVHVASHDFVMDQLPHHMFVHLALNRIAPADLADWLEDHVSALPYDTVRVCYTEYFRTHVADPLADGLRGSRISRMLLAGMLLCGFVPLVRAEQAREEAPTIRRLLRAWANHPALRYGRLIFHALPCSSSQVLGVLRAGGDERLVGLLNVGAQKQIATVSLPVDRLELADGDYELYSVFDDRRWVEAGRCAWRRDELLSIRLTLEPFAAYCLAVRPASPPPAPDADEQPAPADLPLAAEPSEPAALPAQVDLGAAVAGSPNGRRHGRRRRDV